MDFEKNRRDLKFLWNIFLDQLHRQLKLSQNNVTSRALASLGLSSCGDELMIRELNHQTLGSFSNDDGNGNENII